MVCTCAPLIISRTHVLCNGLWFEAIYLYASMHVISILAQLLRPSVDRNMYTVGDFELHEGLLFVGRYALMIACA